LPENINFAALVVVVFSGVAVANSVEVKGYGKEIEKKRLNRKL
jgi:hypothetical protein